MNGRVMPVAVGLLVSGGLTVAQTDDSATRVKALEHNVAALQHRLADGGGLRRYGSENAELGPPKAGENRVVFLGDDLTEGWRRAEMFAGKTLLNRGIAGQTSAQMLVRFQQDVVALKPKVVVIQAG